jgi:2'-hydroxyisoflavone reductase
MKKNNTRREFIKKGLVLAMGVPLIGSQLSSCAQSGGARKSSDKKLSILILGGTSFLGPHQIKYALDRGHSVTTFTRGKTKPVIYQKMFEDVESLIGDREDNLTALENRSWDVVIDNSGRNSEWTKKSAQLLKDKADLYMYLSSTGVYYPYLKGNADESSKILLADPPSPHESEEKKDSYGVMKAKSEIEAIKAFGEDRTVSIRSSYMLGPADMTDRFIHWPIRLAKGGEILVPGKSEDPVQYLDVRDVAEWSIRLCEQKASGTFNAAGPNQAQGMGGFIDSIKDSFDVKSTFTIVDDYEFLAQNHVYYLIPWILPDTNYYGSARINNQKGIKAGLTFRDLKETVRDTHEWWYSDSLSDEDRNKYEKDPRNMLMREADLLLKWKQYKS